MTGKGGRFAAWRGRLPVIAVVVACVAGVVAAVTGAANPVSAVQFLMPGHWVYNSALQAVFHVDGATGDVDARAGVPGGPGDQVFQGDTSGYVVGSERATEFGKSSLEVEGSTETPSRAEPVGVEATGGPYLVYREDGQVVRLGEKHRVLSLGGPIGNPVATRDGTLWLPRTSAGLLCHLTPDAERAACQVDVPKGHNGLLALVDDRLVFVDTADDTVHVVEKDGLGAAHDLAVDVPDDARLATSDVGGRLAILTGEKMHFVDADLDGDAQTRTETVDLGKGDYTGPVSTGSVVAVVDRGTGTLITYDADGERGRDTKLPPESGEPRLSRGEDDRIYVDGEQGTHVVVVDTDGDVTDVPITTGSGDKKAQPTGGKDPDAQLPPVPETQQPPQNQQDQRQQQQPPPPPKPENKPQPPPQVPPSPPGAPTGVAATPGNTTATVTWAPAPANRSAITTYRITWAGGETTVGGGARTATIPGLANGTTYSFAVAAINGVGTGPAATSNPVTPAAPTRSPSAPTGLAPNYNESTRDATLTWAPPADMGTGTFSHYLVGVTGRAETVVGGTSTVFDAIQASGTITFTVKAVTTGPAGQPLVGPAATASVQAPPAPVRALSLSRGAPTDQHCGESSACAWMHVEASGFPPNTEITFMPHSTAPGYSNGGHSTTTDENGFAAIDQFAYAGVGHTVWVTVTFEGSDTTSNRLTWEAG